MSSTDISKLFLPKPSPVKKDKEEKEVSTPPQPPLKQTSTSSKPKGKLPKEKERRSVDGKATKTIWRRAVDGITDANIKRLFDSYGSHPPSTKVYEKFRELMKVVGCDLLSKAIAVAEGGKRKVLTVDDWKLASERTVYRCLPPPSSRSKRKNPSSSTNDEEEDDDFTPLSDNDDDDSK